MIQTTSQNNNISVSSGDIPLPSLIQSQILLKNNNSSLELNETKTVIQNFLNTNKSIESILISSESLSNKDHTALNQEENNDLFQKFLAINKLFDKNGTVKENEELVNLKLVNEQNQLNKLQINSQQIQEQSNQIITDSVFSEQQQTVVRSIANTHFFDKTLTNSKEDMLNISSKHLNSLAFQQQACSSSFDKTNYANSYKSSKLIITNKKDKENESIEMNSGIKTAFLENITHMEGAVLVRHFIETIRRELIAGK